MKTKYITFLLFIFSSSVFSRVVNVVDTITVSPTTINNYGQITISIDWKANGIVEAGDTFTVTLPSQIKTINAQAPMLSETGSQVGSCNLVNQDITCTFSRRAVLGGKITLFQQFEDNSVTSPSTIVPTTYNVNGTPNTDIDMTVSPSVRDPNEILMKFGDLERDGVAVGNTIEWYARVNCRADSINNMIISDEIELGHELDLSSIYIVEGDCNGLGGEFQASTVIYDSVVNTSDPRVTVTGATATNGGSIAFNVSGMTSNAYQITYDTTITDIQSEWHNIITLTSGTVPISEVDASISQEILTATGYLTASPGGNTNPIPSLSLLSMLMLIFSMGLTIIWKQRKF